MVRKLFILILLLAVGRISMAATYYVKPTGNNSLDGNSEANAWQTIPYALSQVRAPGNTIHIMQGTYNVSSILDVAPGVSLEGDGIDLTVINCSNTVTSKYSGCIILNSTATTPRVNGNQSISYMTITGSNLTANRGVHIGYRNNVSVHHVKIRDFKWTGICFRGLQNFNYKPTTYMTGGSFIDSYVDNCATRVLPAEAMSESCSVAVRGYDGFEIARNTFTQVDRQPSYNGNILGGEFNKNFKIHHNTFTKNEDEGSAWNFYFELWHFMGGGEIYSNEFIGGATMDIVDVEKPEGFSWGLKIYSNTYRCNTNPPFTNNQIQAINIEGKEKQQYVYIYDNYFVNYPNGIWIDIHGWPQESIVENGVERNYEDVWADHIYIYRNRLEYIGMTNLDGQPIFIDGYDTWAPCQLFVSHVYIVNNTISCDPGTNNYPSIDVGVIGTWHDIYIQNNIITRADGDAIRLDEDTYNGTAFYGKLQNVWITNNIFDQNGYDGIRNQMNTSIDNYVSSPNWDTDPGIVGARNFNLSSGAYAIDRGTQVSNIIGLDPDGTTPDIGAVYFSQGTTPSDVTQPVITAFTIPATAISLTVSISSMTATDNVGVTGYMLTESSTAPSASDIRWSSVKPSTYTFLSQGSKTLYAWAKDAAGNVSLSVSDQVLITLPPPPVGAKPGRYNGKILKLNGKLLKI